MSQARPPSWSRLLVLPVVVALLILTGAVAGGQAMPRPPYLGGADGFQVVETNHVRVLLQDGAAMTPSEFAVAYGGALDRAYDELTSLLPPPPLRPEIMVFASDEALAAAIAPAPVTTPVMADAGPAMLVTALPTLARQSALEAENALRHALALALVVRTSHGEAPPVLAEGIAAYIERPVSARLARVAALLQNANRENELIAWGPLLAGETSTDDADADLVAAHAYSMVAFLTDRFGVGRLGEFVTALGVYPTWEAALRETYQRGPLEVEQEWRANLPQWTAAGWQTNIVAAFDLQPARDLLAQAHYAAAKTAIGQSLRLATELEDPERLAEAEALQRQADVGLQAESLMTQIAAALTEHDYPRAADLAAQARTQFAQLPPTQRLDDLLRTYETMAETGLRATDHLNRAEILAPGWLDYPAARSAALTGGTAAANLGDEVLTGRASAILDTIDGRQRRLVLLLLALTAMCFAWLAIWLRHRGPGQLDWR